MDLFPGLRAVLEAGSKVSHILIEDVRFPTSTQLHGSDAIHKDPDYSCAYVVISASGVSMKGHGLTFTLGRGTEVVVAAIKALEPLLLGQSLLQVRTFPRHARYASIDDCVFRSSLTLVVSGTL